MFQGECSNTAPQIDDQSVQPTAHASDRVDSPHKNNGIIWGKHHQAVEMKSTAAMIVSSPTNRRSCLAFVPYVITIFLAFSFLHICLKNYLQTISDCEKYLIFN